MRFVPPGRRAVQRHGRLRRRPAHAHPPDRRGAGRAADARRRRRGRGSRGPAVRGPRDRLRARRPRGDRRVGVLAVRLGAAAGRRALRRGRRRAPRRQAGALAAPHRHDGGDAARARRRGRRLRGEPLGGRSRGREAGRPPHRAGPVQRRAVPGAGRGDGRHGDHPRLARGDHPARRPAARPAQPDGLPGLVAVRRGADRDRSRPTACTGSTWTCTTPASSPPRSPPSARWRPAPATCAASRTSAATRPTGWPRWPPSSAGSAPTSPSTRTGCRSGRPRCTAGSSTPTPTTGWRTPG